jgi:hypothetical protein
VVHIVGTCHYCACGALMGLVAHAVDSSTPGKHILPFSKPLLTVS